MKRYIKSNSTLLSLEEESDRVFQALSAHPEVESVTYQADTDSYCISFDQDAEDISWIYDEMSDLGYELAEQLDDTVHWTKSGDFRAWLYEEPKLELYITK